MEIFLKIIICCPGKYLKWLLLAEKLNLTLKIKFNSFPNKPWFLRVCSTSLLKTVGKEEIARNEQFLFFPQYFLLVWRTFCHFDQD